MAAPEGPGTSPPVTRSARRAHRRTPLVFYGWWIVGASFVLQGLVSGLFAQAFGAYFVHLQRDFGWNRTVLSGAFSLAQTESGFFGPVQGWLVDRLGPRAIVRTGIVVFGLGLLALSRINSVVAFYGAILLISLGAGLAGFLTVNATLVNWFERKRATAMGLAATGWGAGGLLVTGLAWSLSALGWRDTALYSGILVVLVGLPAAQLMRRSPEPYGLLPDGAGPRRSAAGGADGASPLAAGPPPGGDDGFTLVQALRSPAFWLINAGHGAALLVVSAGMVHLIPHLVETVGLSLTAAASISAVVTAFSIVGQVSGGFIGDRLDKRLISAGCLLGHMVALLALAAASSLPLVLFFAVVHGLSWGIRGPLMAAIRADYFGRGSFATIFGFSSMVVTFGMLIGPVFAGAMADWLGNYRLGFTLLALLAGASSIFFLLAKKPASPAAVRAQPFSVAAH